jgi:hypothetical protein
MLKRREFIRGAGLMGAGALLPIAAFASPIVRAPAQAGLHDPSLSDLTLQDRSTLAPPPANFSSNHNYFMYGGGQPIRGLKVTIKVDEDIVLTAGMGLQLNGTSPPDADSTFQQYMMVVDPHAPTLAFDWWLENFPSRAYRWDLHQRIGFPCGPAPNPTEQTCKNNLFNKRDTLGAFPGPGDRIPAGYRMVFELVDDERGAVISAKYTVADGRGHVKSQGPVLIGGLDFAHTQRTVLPDFPQTMAPILAFQMNLVGTGNGAHTDLTSGAGTITYEATTPLTPEGKPPVPPAETHTVFTEETSNVLYAELATGARQKIVQRFRAPTSPGSATNATQGAAATCVAPATWDNQHQRCAVQIGRQEDEAPGVHSRRRSRGRRLAAARPGARPPSGRPETAPWAHPPGPERPDPAGPIDAGAAAGAVWTTSINGAWSSRAASTTRPPEPDRVSTGRRLQVQRVARGADGAYGVGGLVGGEGAAQAADMDVDRAGLDVDVRAPDRVQQLFAGEHPAGVLHEVVQQPELGGA